MLVSVLAIWPPLALLLGAASVATLPFPTMLRVAAVAGVVILIFDVTARLRDYRRVTTNLRSNPALLPRHVARYKRSWCQRTVVHWAAYGALGQSGRGYVRAQYGQMGYRWFHIFPDKTFTRESPFLRVSFWKSLIGGTPDINRDERTPAD